MKNFNPSPAAIGLSAVAVSSTTAYTSDAIDAQLLVSASVQVITTGTATGAAKLQMSNDQTSAQNVKFTPTNWTDIASATASITAAGSVLIPKTDLSYRWIRVVYTNATNTGTLSVQVNGIGF